MAQDDVDPVGEFTKLLFSDPDYLTRLRADPKSALAEVGITSDRGVSTITALLAADDEELRRALSDAAQPYGQFVTRDFS
jgi:hypothetical protein